MSSRWKKVVIAVSCSVLFIAPVVLPGRTLSNVDAHFLRMAARVNLEEAHLGEMAEHQASAPEVKNFGQELSNDHTTAYDELSGLARETGEKIPATLGDDKEVNQLMRLDGTQFDSVFLRQQIEANKSVIALFKNEAEHGENADVRDWAKNMIPTLEGHLQTAERLAAEVKIGK